MDVLYLVVDCQTSSFVWCKLEQALASPFNSRIMQLLGSFQDLWQDDESGTQFIQKAKALFDELVIVGRPVSLKDFNLYVFRGLWGEFKDLVTSLMTRPESFSYVDLHSHLLTHEFIHKTSLQSIGSAAITAPLLPTPPLALVAQRQPSENWQRNKGRFQGGWHPNYGSNKGNRSAAPKSNFHSFKGPSSNDGRQGN